MRSSCFESEMPICEDCVEVKQEMSALRETITQWFQTLLPKIENFGEQSAKLHLRLDEIIRVGGTNKSELSIDSGNAPSCSPTSKGNISASTETNAYARSCSLSSEDNTPADALEIPAESTKNSADSSTSMSRNSSNQDLEERESSEETSMLTSSNLDSNEQESGSSSNENGRATFEEEALDLVIAKQHTQQHHHHHRLPNEQLLMAMSEHNHLASQQQPLQQLGGWCAQQHQQTVWPTVTASWLLGQAKQAGEHHNSHHVHHQQRHHHCHQQPPQLEHQLQQEQVRMQRMKIEDIKDFRHLCVVDRLTGRFVCCLCQSSFTQFSNLRRHIRVIHQGASKHACRYCNKLAPGSSENQFLNRFVRWVDDNCTQITQTHRSATVFVWKGAWRRHEQSVHESGKRKREPVDFRGTPTPSNSTVITATQNTTIE